MTNTDFTLDSEIMSRLSNIAERANIPMEEIVKITDFIFQKGSTAIDKGEEINDKFVEESLIDYFEKGRTFYSKVYDNPEALETLTEHTYNTIKRGRYCISHYGRRLTSLFSNSGFFSVRDTLAFSSQSYLFGTELEMNEKLEQYKKECIAIANNGELQGKQLDIAYECISILSKCKVKLV